MQRRVREQAASVARLIVDRGANVLVSGSAKQMPRDVWEAFRDALAGHVEVSVEHAALPPPLVLKLLFFVFCSLFFVRLTLFVASVDDQLSPPIRRPTGDSHGENILCLKTACLHSLALSRLAR